MMYWEKKADLDACTAYFRIFFLSISILKIHSFGKEARRLM